MASYRGAEYVGEQLSSILPQLDEHDEIVIVDDASPDETVEVIRSVDDQRIRLIVQEDNRGYVRTFEHALSQASGDYLLLCDQDDVWLPGHVNVLTTGLATKLVAASNLTILDGPDVLRGPLGQQDWHLTADSERHTLRNLGLTIAGLRPYWGCAMAVRREALPWLLPIPAYVTESHDQYIALFGILSRSISHVEKRTVARRLHDGNQTPTSIRNPLAILSSRTMLARSTTDLVRRGALHASRSLTPPTC